MKSFAISLSLLIIAGVLSKGLCSYVTANFAKDAIPVGADSENSFASSKSLSLSIDGEKVSINALRGASGLTAPSTWNIWVKELKAKDLSHTKTASYGLLLPSFGKVHIRKGVAYTITTEPDFNGVEQLFVSHNKIGSSTSPRIQITSNTNRYHTPVIASETWLDNTCFLVYTTPEHGLNLTSFQLGEKFRNTVEVALPIISHSKPTISCATGEALTLNKLYCLWVEDIGRTRRAIKDAVIDMKNGVVEQTSFFYLENDFVSFHAFSSDATVYGGILTTYVGDAVQYFIKTNINTTMSLLTSTKAAVSTLHSILPYGSRFALIWKGSEIYESINYFSYELYNENAVLCKENTKFLLIDDNSAVSLERSVEEGKLYALLYDKNTDNDDDSQAKLSNIRVGLVLDNPNKNPYFAVAVSIGILATAALAMVLYNKIKF